MKRKSVVCLLTLLCLGLFLVSCQQSVNDSDIAIDKLIDRPENKNLPLKGVWQVKQLASLTTPRSNLAAFSVNDKLYIDRDLVAIRDYVTLSPKFSSKYVNVKQYLLSQYSKLPEVDLPEENAVIIMVRDSDIFSLDFIEEDDSHILFIYESWIYQLERVNDVVPPDTIKSYQEVDESEDSKNNRGEDSSPLSVLLGIRETYQDEKGADQVRYSSYLIYDEKNKNAPAVYQCQGLLVPDEENKAMVLDYVPAGSPSEKGSAKTGQFEYYAVDDTGKANAQILENNDQSMISYVHQNVVSLSTDSPVPNTREVFTQYRTYFLDRLSHQEPLSVDQIAGGKEAGAREIEAFTDQILKQLSLLDPDGLVKIEDNPIDYNNLGIIRQTTSWSFVTSMQWKAGDKLLPSRIPVSLVPSLPILPDYKTEIPWPQITKKLPLARTACQSPHKGRLLIMTDDEIQYYRLYGKRIAESADLSIQLPQDSQLVMLEYYYDDLSSQIQDAFFKLKLLQPQVIYSDH